jgi:hypothetical protein
MSASTRFTQFRSEALFSKFGGGRYSFAVIGFGVVALAILGGVGITLVPHVRELSYQSAPSQVEAASALQSTPQMGLSPSHEAWYVESRSASGPAAPSASSTLLRPWRDAWYLEEDRSVSDAAQSVPRVAQPTNLVADRWFDEPWAQWPASAPTATMILREPLRDRWYLDPKPDAPSGAPQREIDDSR